MLEKFRNFRATRSPHNCYLMSKYEQPHKQTHYPCTGQYMSKPPSDQSPLSPHRAFVIQLTEDMDAEHGRWAGRAEHVTSGQATRFQSLDELLAFVSRVVTALAKQPPDE
jgi:hypothetical protein